MRTMKKLHPREVMLIRRLKVFGLSDERIWNEYRIAIPLIEKAKKEIERQAMEEFENKEHPAVELAMFKERFKIIIDAADSITKDKNLSAADMIKFERIKLDAVAVLQDATEASISCPDPHTALKKIIEKSSSSQHQKR
jgi:hypothetical protein